MMRSHRAVGWLTILVAGTVAGCNNEDVSTSPTSAEAADPAVSALATSGAPTFEQVSAGGYHTCGVATDGRAWCWGLNRDGELGDGTTRNRGLPVLVRTSLRFTQISAGTFHTCALTTGDRVFCWGFGGDGQLGTGAPAVQLKPVAVAGTRRYRDVRAGYRSTCAVTTSRVAFCWGDNSTAQLGDGTRTRRLRPTRVAGGLTFDRVVAGTDHACGLATDDRVYCWGNNNYGQTNDFSAGVTLRPSLVDASPGPYRQASAGDQHGCVVTLGKVAWCWGRSFDGEVGGGSRGVFFGLLEVAGNLRFLGVSPGGAHTCGVTADNLAYCWGNNSLGQLGSLTGGADRLSPTLVAGGLHFRSLHAGIGHTCGVTTSGRAYCWGANAEGQLGNGHTGTGSSVPVPIGD